MANVALWEYVLGVCLATQVDLSLQHKVATRWCNETPLDLLGPLRILNLVNFVNVVPARHLHASCARERGAT